VAAFSRATIAMNIALKPPTPAPVKAACRQFDTENSLIEQTLVE